MGMRTIGLVVALALAGCSQGPQQRTQAQCRGLWANQVDLNNIVEERIKAAARATSLMEQNQALAEAQIAESRVRQVQDVMNVGNCCAYADTCMANTGTPRS